MRDFRGNRYESPDAYGNIHLRVFLEVAKPIRFISPTRCNAKRVRDFIVRNDLDYHLTGQTRLSTGGCQKEEATTKQPTHVEAVKIDR
jgi:hypothetical protein